QEERDKAKRSVWQPLFSLQLRIPSIEYTGQCCLVCSGNKRIDDHCLPSTIQGEMNELINKSRMNDLLVYLKCQELCGYYGLPVTEDTLMKALLYPGDKILFQKDPVCLIRQPGGYYSDLKSFSPNLGLRRPQGRSEPAAKTTDKLSVKPPFSPAICSCPTAEAEGEKAQWSAVNLPQLLLAGSPPGQAAALP
ncbi:hypothetical protein HPG69_006777, partial [Diceros bicornis minor]